MDYQQFLFTITAGLQSACQAEEKITVQTIEQKHTAKIKTVSLYHRGKRTTPWIYMQPFTVYISMAILWKVFKRN